MTTAQTSAEQTVEGAAAPAHGEDGLPAVLGGFDLTDLARFTAGFPHEVFTRLRHEAPVLYHPPGQTRDGEGFWVLSRYSDIAKVGSDIALFSSEGGGDRNGGGTHIDDLPGGLACGTIVNMTDDPRHQLLKDLMTPAVSGQALRELELQLRGRASDIVAAALSDGGCDFQRDIAAPLAVAGVALLLGVPEQDWPRLRGWTDVALGYEDRDTGTATDRSQQVLGLMLSYGAGQIPLKQDPSALDLLSILANGQLPADQTDRPLSDLERQINFALLGLAGSEPVRGAASVGTLALAQHPRQWQALREDRSLLPGTVEEILRWASPTPYNRRTATRDTEIGGMSIRTGEKVTLWWASANRDETIFTDPFTFDITRQPNPHLAFGIGGHDCLGEQVGRMEMRVLLDTLLDQVEAGVLTGPVKWAKHNKHTVVLEMPMRFTGGPGSRPRPATAAGNGHNGPVPASAAPDSQVTDDLDKPTLDPATVAALFGFDPYSAGFKADPYPVYQRLLDQGPQVRLPMGTWAVVSHDRCSEVLRSNDFGIGDNAMLASQFTIDPDGKTVRPFIFADPPEHTRLRSLAGKAFSPSFAESLRPRAQQLAVELLATAREESGGDPANLIAAVADPLSSTMLRELLGIPVGDQGPFLGWSKILGRGLDPDMVLTPRQIAQRQQTRAEFHDYFKTMAAERRAKPTNDLVSALVNVTDENGERLTETELAVTCTLLVGAGEITTVNLIGLATLSLLRNPDQLAWLRQNPDRVADAADELLRYDGPIQFLARQALRDTTVGTTPVSAGEAVTLVIGGANRDPAVHDDPGRLDLSRRRTRAIGFGLGIHFCIGAPLARLTTQSAISAIAALDVELAGEPSYLPNMMLRGLTDLPLSIR
jgi:cytochrome P450